MSIKKEQQDSINEANDQTIKQMTEKELIVDK